MSNNVVSIFAGRQQPAPRPAPTIFADATDIINAIVDWADARGIDVLNDIGFQVRCRDFISHLQLAAKEAEKKTA